MARLLRYAIVLTALVATAGLGYPVGPASSASTPTNAGACGVGNGASWHVVLPSTPCQVDVVVGARVPLRLSAAMRWSRPRVSANAVSVTSRRPLTGGLTGTIIAEHTGTATLTSFGITVCAKGKACPDLAMLWSLRVIVVTRLPKFDAGG